MTSASIHHDRIGPPTLRACLIAFSAIAAASVSAACGGGGASTDTKADTKAEDTKANVANPNPQTKVKGARTDLTGHFAARSYRGQQLAALAPSSPSPSCGTIQANGIYRFIAGEDSCVVAMSPTDVTSLLNDDFAAAVLRRGSFPKSVDAIVNAVNDAGLVGYTNTSYMVGEGSQIPTSIASRDEPRDLRYVLAWASGGHGNILLSAAPGGHSSFLQVISWDDQSKMFNFYEARAQVGDGSETPVKAWTWAGNSAMATAPSTQGNGCFDCHHNGVSIMKELESPWNNWNSQLAAISAATVPQDVASESYFQRLGGAEDLEPLIRNNFDRYYRAWLSSRVVERNGVTEISDVPAMLRHLTTNTTINFESTSSTANDDVSAIPNNFYMWDDLLYEDPLDILDFTRPAVTFENAPFNAFLTQHAYALRQEDGASYTAPGTTHFRFFVPIPAKEDLKVAVLLAQDYEVVTPQFAAAIAMVDLSNPVFSSKRSGLQTYANAVPTATIENHTSSVPGAFAAAIAATNPPTCAPEGDFAKFDACSAESQFLYIHGLSGGDWPSAANAIMSSYVGSINTKTDAEKLDELMRRAAQRRQQFQRQPLIQNLDEFSLLLPQNDLYPLSSPPSD